MAETTFDPVKVLDDCGIPRVIPFEGPDSENPLAFRHYDANEQVMIPLPTTGGQRLTPMVNATRFSVCYWHTMRGEGRDPFGGPTMVRPWEGADTVENAIRRFRVFAELCKRLGVKYYAFHDRDVAPIGKNLAETNRNLDAVVAEMKKITDGEGLSLLWGTANLFSDPLFMHGASTSCNVDAFLFAAAQVAKAMEVTMELGGKGYTLWGGREGYETLLNTNMGMEIVRLARFVHMVVEYKQQIGFTGNIYIEPKPKEPTKHQYDFDVAAVHAFLLSNGLVGEVLTNVETNHATLASHTVGHELEYARINGLLGSVDANTGDLLLGWDTDQFPTDPRLTTQVMLPFILSGGMGKGGVNFDAKVRRPSFEPIDLVYAHIGGMDAFARGTRYACRIIQQGILSDMVDERYRSWDSDLGRRIMMTGEGATYCGLDELQQLALAQGVPNPCESGHQELFENVFARLCEGR